VPRPRRLDTGFLPRQLTFNPEEMLVEFMVDKVAIRQVSVQVLYFIFHLMVSFDTFSSYYYYY